jgi:acyl dehydratase
MALNRALVGKSYPSVTAEVTLEAVQKYARACNDSNRLYFEASSSAGIIAPPMFNAAVTWLALISAISDPELHADLLRLLHRGQDMQFFAPIRSNDEISTRATIISIEDGVAGETLTIGLDASNREHQMVSRTRFTALIRKRREREGFAQPAFSEPPAASREVLFTASQAIDSDQAVRYADASGDRNPIHLDEAVARMAGLPGIILHGLCTMAFSANLIIEHLCGRDPTRLRRLAVTFSRPVFPGDVITTTAWRENGHDGLMRFAYETCNSAGVAVLRGCIAEITSGGVGP